MNIEVQIHQVVFKVIACVLISSGSVIKNSEGNKAIVIVVIKFEINVEFNYHNEFQFLSSLRR